MDRLVRLRTICRRLAVSASVVRQWVTEGKFPAPKVLPSGALRWRVSDVSAWIDALGDRVEPTLGEMPELCQEIVQALSESKGSRVKGSDLARRISLDIDPTGGTFQRALLRLKKIGWIEANQHAGGYALTPKAMRMIGEQLES